MGPHIPSGKRAYQLLAAITLTISATYAQSSPSAGRCVLSSVPTQVRAEGLTERVGDIILQCSGSTPGAMLTGNLTVFFPAGVTNRVDANNLAQGAALSVDYGSGFVPSNVSGLVSNNGISFNGISFMVPPSGSMNLKLTGIRVAVNQLGTVAPQPVLAFVSFPFALNNSQVVVAYPQLGLFMTSYSRGITCTGSPLPSSISFANLLTAGTSFASTRLTEGFAGAFLPRAANEDSGTRFIIKFAGFPTQTNLYVPDFVAGNDALQPTIGGDLGGTPSAGQYAPGSGTLLLARVQGADANGAGGNPVSAPTGAATVNFSTAGSVALSGGSGYVVYEVVDANPAVVETVQFPTFIGISNITAAATASETVTFAPVSTVFSASQTAPVPRFAAIVPTNDCSIVGDCSANYFPKTSVSAAPMQLTAVANGGPLTSQPGYVPIRNTGGGELDYNVNVTYQSGNGWLLPDATTGQIFAGGGNSVRFWTNTVGLNPGTYTATVTIDGGPLAGSVSVPVTLVVTAAPATTSGGTGTGTGAGTG